MAQCDWIHLCDYAFFDQGHKPCIVGIFHVIYAKETPATHKGTAIAFEISGQPHQSVRIKIVLTKPDREDPLFGVAAPKIDLGAGGKHQAIVRLENTKLPDFGMYNVEVWIDDSMSKSTTFEVVPVKEV